MYIFRPVIQEKMKTWLWCLTHTVVIWSQSYKGHDHAQQTKIVCIVKIDFGLLGQLVWETPCAPLEIIFNKLDWNQACLLFLRWSVCILICPWYTIYLSGLSLELSDKEKFCVIFKMLGRGFVQILDFPICSVHWISPSAHNRGKSWENLFLPYANQQRLGRGLKFRI